MTVIAVSPKLSFNLITDDFERRLAQLEAAGQYSVSIYNDAQSPDGTYYWVYVNNGRGPVRPVNAKALHWVDPVTGKDVFVKFAKGVPPRHILENTIAVMKDQAIEGDFSALTADTIKKFVDAVARKAVEEMKSRTPVVTGKLRDSYRIGDEKQ